MAHAHPETPTRYTMAEKLQELQSELGYRKRVYPRLIERSPIKRPGLERRLRILEDCIRDYEVAVANESPVLI